MRRIRHTVGVGCVNEGLPLATTRVTIFRPDASSGAGPAAFVAAICESHSPFEPS